MNTLSHGIWVYYFGRKSRWVIFAALGAIFPDGLYSIPLLASVLTSEIGSLNFGLRLFLIPFKGWDGAYSGAEVNLIHNTLTRLFAEPSVHIIRLIGHSYVIWALLMLMGWAYKKKWLIAFGWGWLSHIFIDMLTHVDDAIPYFYPLWNRTIRGIVSYWNPRYHGTYFATANYIAVLVLTILLFQEWWKKRKLLREEDD